MSITYQPTTPFGAKDNLPANDPNKVIVGAEFTAEFNAIQAAFASAAPTSNPTFSGTATYNNINVTGTFTSRGIDDNAASTAITIDSNENVGIGTTNPTEALTVAGTGYFSSSSAEVKLAPGTAIGLDFGASYASIPTAQNHGYVATATSGAGGANGDLLIAPRTSAATSIRFITGTAPTERMTLDAAGNVGIGGAPGVNTGYTTVTVDGATNGGVLEFSNNGVRDGLIYSTTANDLAVQSGPLKNISLNAGSSNPTMTLNYSGDVGIGTTSSGGGNSYLSSANTMLKIKGSSANKAGSLQIQSFGSSNDSIFEVAAFDGIQGCILGTMTNGPLSFQTNNATRATIDAVGNLGIGTAGSTLTARLSVDNVTNGAEALRIGSYAGGSGATTGETYLGFTAFSAGTAQTYPHAQIGVVEFDASDSRGSLVFGTRGSNSDVAPTERMRIDAAGNVGIGTDAPSALAKLDVVGGGIRVYNGTSATTGFLENRADTTDLRTVFGNGDLTFSTGASSAGTERMRIAADGSVGIGDPNPTPITSNAATLTLKGQVSSKTGGLKLESSDKSVDGYLYGDTGNGITLCNRLAGELKLATNNTNRVIIDASGNVGIGEDAPAAKLEVYQPLSSRAGVFNVGATTATYRQMLGFQHSGTDVLSLTTGPISTLAETQSGFILESATYLGFNVAGSSRMRVDSSGNVLVGAGKTASNFTFQGVELHPTGAVIATTNTETCLIANRNGAGEVAAFYIDDVKKGFINQSTSGAPTFGAASDERLKDNIVEHDSELANVMALRPVVWDWKDGSGAGEGFIAQEVEQTGWSDLVGEDPDSGFKNLAGLGTVETRLIKAMQEQQAMIEALKAEVEALKNA